MCPLEQSNYQMLSGLDKKLLGKTHRAKVNINNDPQMLVGIYTDCLKSRLNVCGKNVVVTDTSADTFLDASGGPAASTPETHTGSGSPGSTRDIFQSDCEHVFSRTGP